MATTSVRERPLQYRSTLVRDIRSMFGLLVLGVVLLAGCAVAFGPDDTGVAVIAVVAAVLVHSAARGVHLVASVHRAWRALRNGSAPYPALLEDGPDDPEATPPPPERPAPRHAPSLAGAVGRRLLHGGLTLVAIAAMAAGVAFGGWFVTSQTDLPRSMIPAAGIAFAGAIFVVQAVELALIWVAVAALERCHAATLEVEGSGEQRCLRRAGR